MKADAPERGLGGWSARCLAGLQARPWRRAAAWLVLLAPFFYLSYGLANHLAARRAAVPSLVFVWEQHIPFWDWTIFPYWSLNVFYGLSLFVAASRHELDRHAARLLTAQCIAVACFIAFPLRFSFGQPEAHGAAGLLFAALRGFDQPFNQAPSLHIALVVILWDLYRRLLTGPFARGLLHGWALLICLSVLTTYQHHFIDIPTGALLGVVCVWAWPLERQVSMWQAWRLSGDAQRQRLGALYACGAALFAAAAAVSVALGWPWGLWLCWPAVSLLAVALNYLGFGARGFQMDSAGRMAWPARWLLGPYRLGALLNARAWTRRQPAAREIGPGVWLGSLSRMASRDLAAVPGRIRLLSLCAELQTPRRHPTLCLPWLDLAPASAPSLRRAADAIDGALARGDTVLMACALGFSRSAAVVVCWLARSGRARGVDDALMQLRQLHPQLVLGPRWISALHQACRPATRAGDAVAAAVAPVFSAAHLRPKVAP